MRKAPKLLPLLLLAAAACAPKSDAGDDASNPIVSNGGQTYTQFIATVRLSSPPLLATARLENGKPVIDPGAKQKLLAEQQKFLDGLKSLPGQIKVLYTYRLTLNAFSLLVPIELKDKFTRMPGVISIEEEAVFERPDPQGDTAAASVTDLTQDNSVNFIEGGAAHALGLTGQGLRIGVIDTGIDYTHKMFGGAGTPDAYTANDPTKVEEGTFPTGKIVGGIDLVGTNYNAASIDEKLRVPTPDADPLDEAGHGSHVAGTIAGHGDGTNTYDGVAPDAQLYAIKIFGKTGSTGDGPILAAFEFAADPNQDLDPGDRLDAVNLSLGANYGTQFAEYEEAIKNLANAGTVTLCAAGNAGATPYIVSSPGTAEHAISVAAAIDNSPWNWRFDAAEFAYPENPADLQQIVDAAFTKPSKDSGVSGKLAYIGTAATDLTDEQKAAVKGNVALIDRGVVSFVDKVRRANDAGAIGVVMVNSQPGAPIVMGGDGKSTFNIPAFMVTLDFGATIKADIAAGKDVTVNFATGKTVDHPELIDQLTDFSSRGPRSIDGLIKPEVTGPGFNVISAKMGSGAEGVKFSGTSMATPHLTGAIALLRQAHPEASVAELKARVMNATAAIHDAKGPAGVAAQGGGRVQIVKAAQAPLYLDPPALSLGVMAASAPASASRTVTVANTSDSDVHATVSFAPKAGLTITGPSTIDVPAHGTKKVTFGFNVDLSQASDVVTELDNLIHVTAGDSVLSLPVLAEGRKGSTIKLASFSRTSNGGPIDMAFSNGGPQAGDVMAFNLLGQEKASAASQFGACALSSAGYRIVQKTDPATGTTTNLLEFAVRLVTPLSTWNACEVSVLFDANGDGVPEQELAGAAETSLWATPAPADPFASFLVDAPHMRDIEAKSEQGQPADKPSAAVLDQQPFTRFPFSPVGIIAADLSKVAKTPNGLLRFQIGTLPFYTGGVRDDFLANATWFVVDPNNTPFRGMNEKISIASGASAQFETQMFVPGSSLLLYFPQNDASVSTQLVVPATGRPR